MITVKCQPCRKSIEIQTSRWSTISELNFPDSITSAFWTRLYDFQSLVDKFQRPLFCVKKIFFGLSESKQAIKSCPILSFSAAFSQLSEKFKCFRKWFQVQNWFTDSENSWNYRFCELIGQLLKCKNILFIYASEARSQSQFSLPKRE